jgi:hypothetical protein
MKKNYLTALPNLPTSDGPTVRTQDQGEDRLILRVHAAKIIGTSVPSLRRLEKSGALKPILVDAKGVHWHSLRLVQEYAAQMKALVSPVSPAESLEGAVAAEAFELLDGGASAADLVKTLKLLPAAARSLQSEWADLRGGMVLSGRALSRIASIWTEDDTTIASEDALLRYLERLDPSTCASCGRPPAFCMSCFHHRPRRALEVVALARRRAEERRAEGRRRQAERETFWQARVRAGTRSEGSPTGGPSDRGPSESGQMPKSRDPLPDDADDEN